MFEEECEFKTEDLFCTFGDKCNQQARFYAEYGYLRHSDIELLKALILRRRSNEK